MKFNRLDIGELIRKKVEERGISKAKFAEQLGIARQNIEKTVFQKRSIDTDLLCNICEVLECNFFDYFQEVGRCNKNDYNHTNEVKATLSIEMESEKQEQVLRFIFGKNNIEILNK